MIMKTNMKNKIVMMAIAMLVAVGAQAAVIPAAPNGCSTSTSVFGNATDFAIADGAGVTVSDIFVDAPDGMSIYDVNATIDITSGHSGDLKIYLIPPSGKVIVLSTGNGGAAVNVFSNTVFDDDAGDTNAPGAVTDVTLNTAELTLVPESAMGTMIGYNPTG